MVRTAMHEDADCKFPAGVMIPVVDITRCEAKGPCVPACPYDVIAIRPLTADEKAGLTLPQRFKAFVHGNKLAFATDPDACRGCGLCVQICPERAIKLRRVDGG